MKSGQKDFVRKVDKIKAQVVWLETRSNTHGTVFCKVEQDCKYLETETGKLSRIIEDLDNTQRRNNQRLKGLKEGVEEGNLKQTHARQVG